MATVPTGRSRATIIDVAQAAGVSRQTVSNSLKHPERVRPDTLERVLAEIDRLDYTPSTAATSLRDQRAGAVGIELTGLGTTPSEALAPFLLGLAVHAPAHDCHIVTFATDADRPEPERYRSMWRSRLVDAFVMMDTHPDDPRPGWLRERRVPFASFGRVWDDPSFTAWADVDGRAGTSDAVDHLAARGYERIGWLGWPDGSAIGDERRSGWVDALERHGLDGPEARAEQDLVSAMAAAEGLVDSVGGGGAIVCTSDVLALGVHQVLLRRGLIPGRDVGIVGFDGSQTARTHGLTSVHQPYGAIADTLLTQVHDQLTDDELPSAGVMLAPELVPDASTERT
ncbi:LacI family transcriptional regulator [Knoellia remsis]|uniref:LacI family transcriptional regulator n=1 Tax=Knoellia remsis TaxID=407159 RepID=A0A2T0UXC9_9MICO|nr:LacI family DNA-binding transcriptional regulator [Knoellia remsis]PRY62581.1 LacI family transcriptional regulator [Knoellia remsis]